LTLDWLEELRDGSLLLTEECGRGEMRYRLLETMREYAQEQMRVEEASGLARRHAEYYTALAEEAEPHLKGAEQKMWLDRLEADLDNLRAAFDWSLQDRQEAGGPQEADQSRRIVPGSSVMPEFALRLVGAIARFWFYRHPVEGRERLAAALARLDPSERTAARAKALLGAGMIAYYYADYHQTRALCTESLEISRELGDKAGMAIACIYLGNTEFNLRQLGENVLHAGVAFYEQSLALSREIGDTWGVAYALNNLGLTAVRQGDKARARTLFEESLRLRRALGDGNGIAMSLNNLAHLARDEENYAKARTLLQECVAILREIGDRHSVASGLMSLSEIIHCQGDSTAALPCAEESVAHFREMADRVFLWAALHQLIRILRKLGDLTRARAQQEESLALAKELKSQSRLLQSLASMGEILTERGDFPSARVYLRQGIQAVAVGVEDEDWHTPTVLSQSVAAFATAQGQPEAAARLLGAVAARWDLAGAQRDPRDETEFQARLAPLRAELGEAAFTTAWEAGRALSREQALALARDTLQ
jgi:tetratricopeptide (TPR) repeat protein